MNVCDCQDTDTLKRMPTFQLERELSSSPVSSSWEPFPALLPPWALPLCPTRTPMVLPPPLPCYAPHGFSRQSYTGLTLHCIPVSAQKPLPGRGWLTVLPKPGASPAPTPWPSPLHPLTPSAPQPITGHMLSLCPAFSVFSVLITRELMLQRPVLCLLSACSKMLSVTLHVPSQWTLSTQWAFSTQ
ncbi:hypothetical protein mRhiFer1_009096 [Rhinolophus ferrumequinum]|uniref:Uncharacterized protein n=1 Tax=Rhinolophus ferrumequinum TaxID=59479 RepID=A0A7J7SXP1_RHIFE|nr:hypothetical protein mRhiFer1_009096 [Rhinolophus ferrumequinum]